MTELERVPLEGEVVEEPEVTVNDCIDEWTSAATHVIWGQLRQARAAAKAKELIGKGWAKEFGKQVEVEKTTVYNFARVWWMHGHRIQDGDSGLSARLDSGRITMTNLIKSTYAPDPMKSLNAVEDGGLSTRQQEAMNREEREQEHAEDPRVEEVKTPECPSCGAIKDHWQRPPVEVSNG